MTDKVEHQNRDIKLLVQGYRTGKSLRSVDGPQQYRSREILLIQLQSWAGRNPGSSSLDRAPDPEFICL
jgi:hypothetical protein